MLKSSLCFFACLSGLALVSTALPAQEVIHALTGTVAAINSPEGTITVLQDNGSRGTFEDKASPKTHIAFDKRIAGETTAATAFNQNGAYVIVFYYGTEDRIAVAFKNLGSGPFTSTVGTVERYDGHSHEIEVKDDSGSVQTFRVNAQTIAESGVGAIDGLRFQAQKGDHVRIVARKDSGAEMVLFVRD